VPAAFPISQFQFQESAISHMQMNVDNLWEDYQEKYKAVLGPNVSTANITYAMGLVRGEAGGGARGVDGGRGRRRGGVTIFCLCLVAASKLGARVGRLPG
jgi:hypothetical protein